MVTLAQYKKMTSTQRKKLRRDEIDTLLDEVLDTDMSGDTTRSVITETLNKKLDEKFKDSFTQELGPLVEPISARQRILINELNSLTTSQRIGQLIEINLVRQTMYIRGVTPYLYCCVDDELTT